MASPLAVGAGTVVPSASHRASYAGASTTPIAALVLGKCARGSGTCAENLNKRANSPSAKSLKQQGSFTSNEKKRKSSAEVKPDPADAMLIIGFDAEWVTEVTNHPDADVDGDCDCDARPSLEQIPRNRILSYQYACRYKGHEWSGIVYTRACARIRYPDKPRAEIEKCPDRIGFAELMAIAIADGIEKKQLTRWPKKIAAAAHWTRGDLSAMADFARIKGKFDGVQKTYVTLGDAFLAQVNVGGHIRAFQVSLVDTLLLVPGSAKSLSAVGDLYEFSKLDPGSKEVVRSDGNTERIPYIERMDLLLADNLELYERYAIRDAEISARHTHEVWRFANEELSLNLSSPPITLGALAARNLVQSWSARGIDIDAVLDGRVERIKLFDANRRRRVTVYERWHSHRFTINEKLAELCFHGGRNECFSYGPTIDTKVEATPPFREFDLISAYAVAMASIRMPDWKGMYDSTDVAQFGAGLLGIARVSFRFPTGTRFPSLPVVAPDDYGLVYPLEGEAYATANEIAVARHQGAEIEILDGVIVPWRDDGPRPFMLEIDELQRRRNQHPKGSLSNEMFKQLANSIYGKLGQGIKGTSVYDTRTDGRSTIGRCEITNAFLAGYVSGSIRALISELIAGIPSNRAVVSVTTDAFITNAEIGEISMGGPVATSLSGIKQNLMGDTALLETKFEARQLLPWRTRGVSTLIASDGAKPKLARGGMREPGSMSLNDANDWFAQRMLLRQPGDKWSSRDPLSFPKAHRANADHVFQQVTRTVNFEFDMKRRPINSVPRYVSVPADRDLIVQHLAFETAPWLTVDEFVETRQRFDQWRLKCPAQLRTTADWRLWLAYRNGSDASLAGVHRSSKGPIDQARRLVVRAYRFRRWGLPGGDYRGAAARLTQAGYPTTEQDFKNAGRAKRRLAEHLIPADAEGVRDFVAAVVSIWPEFEWRRLVKGEVENLRDFKK